MNNIERIGRFPEDGPGLRRRKRIVAISEQDRLKLLHGPKANMLVQIGVSNDYLHEGIVTIPGRVHSEPDRFDGDSAFIPQNGPVSFTVGDDPGGPKPVSRERFVVQPREIFFLPARTSFRMHNFSSERVDVIFITAAKRRKGTGR